MLPETQERIELEIAQIGRLVDVHRDLLLKVADTEPDSIELSALSAYLHSFYSGIENVFKQIAADIDGKRPSSDQWHADLLRSMAVPTRHRPPVISEHLLNKLLGYMAFRHVFRHAYTFDLKWRKMEVLVLESEDVLHQLHKACITLFMDAA